VIRTQELLAARRVDGGRQFFSRARDFGYSKDYRDTLTKWDRQQVLSDIVRVIRLFRPDVIITRFPPEPSNTHGHHTASAALALEAFKLAGDPKAFPEQLADADPVAAQAHRLERLRPGNRGGGETARRNRSVHVDASTAPTRSRAPRLPSSPRAAGRCTRRRASPTSRWRPPAAARAPNPSRCWGGEPADKDIMDGVDTTWGRVPGGAEIGRLADEVIDHFDPPTPRRACRPCLRCKPAFAASRPTRSSTRSAASSTASSRPASASRSRRRSPFPRSCRARR
jgi:LmbE family N-acetylglucosaminyl deacetylase